MNILSLSHSLPLSNSLVCVKYLSCSLKPGFYHSSISTDFNTWYAHEKEGRETDKQSQLKAINHTIFKSKKSLLVAVIGIYTVCSLFGSSSVPGQKLWHEIHSWNMSTMFDVDPEGCDCCECFEKKKKDTISMLPSTSNQLQPSD